MIKLSLLNFLNIFLLFIIINSDLEHDNIVHEPNIAVIPFKTFYPPWYQEGIRPFKPKDFYNTIHYSSSYFDLEIGKIFKQRLSLFFTLDDYYFHLDDNFFNDEKSNNLLCHYSSNLSDSYEIIKTNDLYIANNKRYSFAKEYFKIYSDLYLNNYNLYKFNFHHSLKNLKNISYACGKIGLLYASEDLSINMADYNFINQIHKNIKNIETSWTFRYNLNINEGNNYDGLFIIGIESLEKNKNKNELITIYTKLTECGNILEWKFPIDELYIGNYFYEINNEEIKFDTDIEGFEIPKIFLDKLNEKYFDRYFTKKICESEMVAEYYKIIYCNSDKFMENDIEKFPKIIFYKYKIGFNFSFTGKELFFKKDKKYFFRMITNTKNIEKDFKVGRLFLKKYQVIFNSDEKSMSFYKLNNNKKNIYDNNNKNKNMKRKKIFINIISYFGIGLLFLGIGIFFGRRYCFIDKKRLANELEDDNYEYKSKKNALNNKAKLIEME